MTRRRDRLKSLAGIIREPVLAETRRNLKRSWERVPESFRVPQQMLGRGGNGCGATIGAMPRCDFACVGCYLGDGANDVPAEPVEAIKAQMRRLRPILGNGGNLQLTDGEVTLRPEGELIELLRYARALDLIPMLMTHGDSFRRRPGLLERLVVEGGLVEVSIHVDTTQRGRRGAAYKYATREEDLMPLRDEFAELIRSVMRGTGKPLRAATTMTVTAENLDGVPSVVRWLMRNADAFRLISFQPVAQVGRTAGGLGGGVAVENLWTKIAEGLQADGATGDGGRERVVGGQMWIGHPGCNRYLPGIVTRAPGAPPRFHALRQSGDSVDERVVGGFLDRFGGITFRLDSPVDAVARWIGLVLSDPRFVLGGAPGWLMHWLRKFDAERPLAFAWKLLRGRARADGLVIISHHFMSRAEIETPVGQERLDLCVFQVPVGTELRSMCEVNALGIRDEHYARISARDSTRGSLPTLAPP